MATGKTLGSKGGRAKAGGGWRRWRTPVLVLAILLAGLWWYFHAWIGGKATLAASYGAHVACTCHYIGGRELSQCRDDFEPGMGVVMLSQDETAQSVTARIPLLASETAHFRPGWGCTLQPWED